MYQNYIFDLYGTLIDIKTDEQSLEVWNKVAQFYRSRGAEYTGLELRERFDELYRQQANGLRETIGAKTGRLIQREEVDVFKVYESLFKEKKVEVSQECIALTAEWFRIMSTERIQLYDGVYELFQALKKKKKRLILLSNAQSLYTRPELKLLGLESWFDAIYLSSEWQHQKPDPAFFELPLEQLNLKKSDTIMIGNDPKSDILGAHQIGLDSIYFNTDHRTEKERDGNATYVVNSGIFRDLNELISTLL